MNEALYVRRCHVCNAVSESQGQPVRRCDSCAKHFAPFYYFDELGIPIGTAEHQWPQLLPNEYRPVIGLSTWWS